MTTFADAYRQAAGLLETGRAAEAEHMCRQLLASAPGHADTLHLLGLARWQRGDLRGAMEFIVAAIGKNARSATYHVSLARVQLSANDTAQAERSFSTALKLEPKSVEANFHYASYLLSSGRPGDAITHFKRTIGANPRHATAHNGLALALTHDGKLEEALVSSQRAISLKPDFAEAYLNLGLTHRRRGDLNEALTAYQTAIKIQPHFPEAYNNIGSLCYDEHRYEDALDYCREALRLKPDLVSAHVNLGHTLRMLGRFKEAKASLECALALRPNALDAYIGLGMIAEMEGDLELSLHHYRRVREISPDYPAAHYNEAISMLRRGELAEAWPKLEWRWKSPTFTSHPRPFHQPLWQGGDPGGTLLVWAEQGVGDEILYASMIPDLVDRNIPLIIECEPRLVPLFARAWPTARVIARAKSPAPETADPAITFQTPMASLARWLRPNFAAFPQRDAYLVADPHKRAQFCERLAAQIPERSLKIGISWLSKNAAVGAKKSSSLREWAPILERKDARFIDLQYGDTAADRAAARKECGVDIVHFKDQDNFADIDGLAALISACDLVITVSNTTAHLAGALGVPAMVMIPAGIGQTWYWFADSAASPWYPSLTLYRQKTAGDWRSLLKQVGKALRDYSRIARA